MAQSEQRIEAAGSQGSRAAAADRLRVASSDGHPMGQPSGSTELRAMLREVLSELGFETASLFVPGAGSWELLERVGPERSWHGVLDPSALEGTPEAAEYPDVRTVPGVGARLVGMGCSSLATLPIPDGGRLLLDSATPAPQTGWIRRVRPYLSLISVMAGSGWSSNGSLRSHQEAKSLESVFELCQELLARPTASLEELLAGVRDAVGADELVLLVQRGDDVEVRRGGDGNVERLSGGGRAGLLDEHGRLGEPTVQELITRLGSSSRAIATGIGRGQPDPEVLLAGWLDGPALSADAMGVLARAVSTARSALHARTQAVTSVIDKERTRMAYALHDGLTQTVAGAVLELEALRKRIEKDPDDAIATLDRSKSEIRRALAELRAVLFDLTEGAEQPDGRGEPLTRYVDDVVMRWRLPARISVEGDLARVPARTLSVAYVVIREALANAAKHAAATNVTVNLSAEGDKLRVVVGDAGRGFTRDEERAARESHHFGLEMLRRRVREVGGTLTVHSRPGKGTRVIARLPMGEVVS